MLISGGELVLSDAVPSGHPNVRYPTTGLNLTARFASYGAIYRAQLWVYTVVRKRAMATRRLPLKVYQRGGQGRDEVRDHPLAVLLRDPNPRHSAAFLWEWTSSTLDVYGEAIWFKVRRNGRPALLWPIHPSNIAVRLADDGSLEYVYSPGLVIGNDPQLVIPERDVVHFKTYNPEDTQRGLSPLEPLRQTLVNEDAARRASSAFWSNGARPSGYLSHPGKLSPEALTRLRDQWNQLQGGVDNFGKWAILEEGLEPKPLSLTAEDAQYVESRRLNREEVCAAYDVPPPVVHILDRATFSNITEQMRSMYRDTMAPHLGGLESTLDFQLASEWSDGVYAEFLMDEVLRGDFEQRVDSYQKGINSGWLTPAEVRQMENLPFVAGSDQLLVNAAIVSLDGDGFGPNERAKVDAASALIRAGFEPEAALEAVGLPPIPHTGLVPITVKPEELLGTPQAKLPDSFWGRLGTYSTLAEVEPGVLTAGLNGASDMVRGLLADSIEAGETINEFKARVRAALSEGDHA